VVIYVSNDSNYENVIPFPNRKEIQNVVRENSKKRKQKTDEFKEEINKLKQKLKIEDK
jgi:hypothetical protein